MDILFKNDDFVFSYRVGGILKHNGKILLQRPKNDDYAIIGGHVAAMETSMETLKREFEEEMTNMNKADYNQNHNSTSINHFYEKLLLLKDMMNTETAKKMAMHRQTVMEDFLEEFMAEWEGEK